MSYSEENEVVIFIDEGIMDDEEEKERQLWEDRARENRTDHNERQRDQAEKNKEEVQNKIDETILK